MTNDQNDNPIQDGSTFEVTGGVTSETFHVTDSITDGVEEYVIPTTFDLPDGSSITLDELLKKIQYIHDYHCNCHEKRRDLREQINEQGGLIHNIYNNQIILFVLMLAIMAVAVLRFIYG